MLDALKTASAFEASVFSVAANLVIFAGSVGLCGLLGKIFRGRRIFDRWEPLRPVEVLAAVGAVVFNTGVSVVGWALWKQGFLSVSEKGWAMGVVDCVVMLCFMDFGMYFLHRLVHHDRVYPLFHRFHHRHETTNPISLFVLHPVEVLGFGFLMIAFLWVYPISVGGLVGYLTLNVLWGTLGHSGVEPFPGWVRRVPLVALLGTSTFHAEHHEHPRFNFGFYTLVWDRIFGTLDPEYADRFRRASLGVAPGGVDGDGQC